MKCFNVKLLCLPTLRSSAISNKVALALSSPILNPRPIDCKLRILDFDGEANMILWRLRILIPVLKVP